MLDLVVAGSPLSKMAPDPAQQQQQREEEDAIPGTPPMSPVRDCRKPSSGKEEGAVRCGCIRACYCFGMPQSSAAASKFCEDILFAVKEKLSATMYAALPALY